MLKTIKISGKKQNVELTALSIFDKVLPVLEEKKYAICGLLDYTTCFDILSRSILFDKLEDMTHVA